MKEYKEIQLSDGISAIFVKTDRFRTNEMAVTFQMPLEADKASSNALTISYLTHYCKAYPTLNLLNRKLSMMYGADIYASVIKSGNTQLLSINGSVLNDRYSLDGQSIVKQCLDLIVDMLMRPNFESGKINDKDLEVEKNILIDKINREFNDKRIYALNKASEIMFENDPYSISRFGTIDSVEAIKQDDVNKSLSYFLNKAKIQFTFVGDIDESLVFDSIKPIVENSNRNYKQLEVANTNIQSKEIKRIEEELNITQGKLVMGFTSDVGQDTEKYASFRIFCDLFGGGPYSKLFANVREKMSLCYYCSSRLILLKSAMFVQSGCEEQNMDSAESEILNQLNEIVEGNFDSEFESSIKGYKDSVLSANDESLALLGWYIGAINYDKVQSPNELAQEIDMVTKNDIISIAKNIKLNTVLRLVGKKEGNNEGN